MDEFREFNKYLAYMESQGAHRAGVAKVKIYNIEGKMFLIPGFPVFIFRWLQNWPFFSIQHFFQMILNE